MKIEDMSTAAPAPRKKPPAPQLQKAPAAKAAPKLGKSFLEELQERGRSKLKHTDDGVPVTETTTVSHHRSENIARAEEKKEKEKPRPPKSFTVNFEESSPSPTPTPKAGSMPVPPPPPPPSFLANSDGKKGTKVQFDEKVSSNIIEPISSNAAQEKRERTRTLSSAAVPPLNLSSSINSVAPLSQQTSPLRPPRLSERTRTLSNAALPPFSDRVRRGSTQVPDAKRGSNPAVETPSPAPSSARSALAPRHLSRTASALRLNVDAIQQNRTLEPQKTSRTLAVTAMHENATRSTAKRLRETVQKLHDTVKAQPLEMEVAKAAKIFALQVKGFVATLTASSADEEEAQSDRCEKIEEISATILTAIRALLMARREKKDQEEPLKELQHCCDELLALLPE